MVQNSKSKKAKQTEKAPPVSNGCNDSEQSQTVKNAASKNLTENESETNTASKVKPEINEITNGDGSETSSNDAKSATNSRKKKAAESATETENVKTAVSESAEEKSTVQQSKSKGRPKKDKNSEMEIVDTAADEPCSSGDIETEENKESSEKSATSRKRKASPADEDKSEPIVEAETVENTAAPKKSGRKAAATKSKEEETKLESAETTEPAKKSRRKDASSKEKETVSVEQKDKIEQESTETSVPQQKSRKRKVAEPVKTETKSKKKEIKKAVPVTKSKKQKVLLSIPSVTSVAGKVFVIGENDVGQLGFDEEIEVKKRPAMLELPYSITDIAAGGMHSVCLTESGEVITFGCNDEGALGRITKDDAEAARPGRVEIPERIIQISAGDSHTAALAESGQVYLWGNFRSGDGPMGLTVDGAKQVKPIKIFNKIMIVKISSGTEHLVCLSNEGKVYTCGCGQNGQLGRLNERICRDGGRRGLASFLEPEVVPVYGHPNSKVKSVLIADVWGCSYSTFFKTQETGLIYACGLNNYNQLGYANEQVTFFPRQVGSFNDRTWEQIAGGQHHTLSLDCDGLVCSLGRRDYGRLGLGEDSEEVVSSPTLITSLENEKCINISCGNVVSFAVTEDGSLFSWGFGTNHQLGHGNDDDCHVPRLVEGNFLTSWKSIKVSGGGQHTLVLAIPKESAKSDIKK